MVLRVLDVTDRFVMKFPRLVRKGGLPKHPVLRGAALFVGAIAAKQGHALKVPQQVSQLGVVTLFCASLWKRGVYGSGTAVKFIGHLFYNTSDDPREWTNQIANPKFTETIRALQGAVPEIADMPTPLPNRLQQK